MQNVSTAFLAEVTASHTIYSYADVVTPDGNTYHLTVTKGSVTVDRSANVRRRASITAIDPEGALTPLSATSPLAPFGSMLYLYRGVKYTTGALAGSTEVAPLGVFRISDVSYTDTAGTGTQSGVEGTTSTNGQAGGSATGMTTGGAQVPSGGQGTPGYVISAYDLSRTISRDKFTTPYNIAVGTNCIAAAQAVIERTIDNPTYDVFQSATTTSAPLVYDTNDDPWDVVQTLVEAAGCECYFSATGHVVIAPPVDIDHLPSAVFGYIENQNCTMLEVDIEFTDEPGYNGVVVIGQATGDATPPVRSVAWDTNPNSVTYYLGPYGQVPMIITNSVVSTQGDADAAALAQLNLVLGFFSQLTVTATVNPALDVNDIIAVQRKKSGLNSSYAIDSITIPLDAASTQDIGLRQKRVT